jgi:Cu+-exporting ATPase
LAKAVVAFAKDKAAGALVVPQDFSNEDGRGVQAIVDGMQVRVGAFEFCFGDCENIEAAHSFEKARGSQGELYAFFSISKDNHILSSGTFSFRDQIRPSAKALVRHLGELNIPIMMLSGDRSGHLEQVANELGIDRFEACWPHEKALRVGTLRDEGHTVVMVGDGGNDAAALATANVGISVGAGGLAAESASVALMNDDLENVARLIEMSRRVVKIAKNTVGYGMSLSMCQMVLAAFGIIPPFASAVGQEIIDLGAVLHSLRALKG